ncbi:MAG: aspartate-semialdehyde dehydrogenase [Ignavibacteriaceae bacterium]|nr:aspartate-semialdehyde dehydrogenase [Ignavibacteriaceae bacterium]
MGKIGVAILGATGSVGQKFLELLADHPIFEVTELAASEKSAEKKYKDATNWIMQKSLPKNFGEMIVKECKPNLNSKIVFSALDASVAGDIEEDFAKAGYIVISNARNHRYDANVPLIIPEVNPDHLEMIKYQKYGSGAIITNPNCSTIGLVLALKPLQKNFGLESVNVVTLQAISGAGYPGLPSMDIIDNSIPFIGGEEPKMEKEPLKILGKLNAKGDVDFANIKISAQCNRVAVNDGHLENVQVKFVKKPSAQEIIEAWINFKSEPQQLNLPSAPKQPIYYFYEDKYPQPKIHRNLENGMAASVGRLRECSLFDFKFVVLSHNTVRGAAGGTILIAELLHAKGYLPNE